tara:strand:- start:1964 stop:3187 length:1224 start_codon:yes stop_codon:yes gene_type:complete
MKNKKILIVSHQFLPYISPRTTRWKFLIDELITRGNEVTILTGTNPNDLVNNYDVLYFGNKNMSSAIDNLRKDSTKVENSFIKKNLYSLLKKIYRFIFKSLAWPDYAMFWIFTIIKNKSKIPKNFDIIISVSLPFTSHVCGSILNKSMSSKWFMDIGDPFSLKEHSFENNRFLYSFINSYFEKKYYQMADKIIFTHTEASKLHMDKFQIDSSKLVIGHPISLIDENIIESSNKYAYIDLPIKIGYFGIFTDGVRDPYNYLNTVASSFKEEFHHYWFINDASIKYFSSLINSSNHKFKTMIPREDALNEMINNFHILLSIGNKNNYQLPSKVIEYISLGKPVLHYAEISSDPMYRFESLFKNFKIIDKNTRENDVMEFLKSFQIKKIEFNYKEFNKHFSPKGIIDNLY